VALEMGVSVLTCRIGFQVRVRQNLKIANKLTFNVAFSGLATITREIVPAIGLKHDQPAERHEYSMEKMLSKSFIRFSWLIPIIFFISSCATNGYRGGW
jgi:hypothetical protein